MKSVVTLSRKIHNYERNEPPSVLNGQDFRYITIFHAARNSRKRSKCFYVYLNVCPL